jgi:hypothetical protein
MNFYIVLDAVIVLIIADVRPAMAYVDPGAGSVLLQVVLGGAAGLAVLARIGWQRIKQVLRRSSVDTHPDAQHGPRT